MLTKRAHLLCRLHVQPPRSTRRRRERHNFELRSWPNRSKARRRSPDGGRRASCLAASLFPTAHLPTYATALAVPAEPASKARISAAATLAASADAASTFAAATALSALATAPVAAATFITATEATASLPASFHAVATLAAASALAELRRLRQRRRVRTLPSARRDGAVPESDRLQRSSKVHGSMGSSISRCDVRGQWVLRHGQRG